MLVSHINKSKKWQYLSLALKVLVDRVTSINEADSIKIITKYLLILYQTSFQINILCPKQRGF